MACALRPLRTLRPLRPFRPLGPLPTLHALGTIGALHLSRTGVISPLLATISSDLIRPIQAAQLTTGIRTTILSTILPSILLPIRLSVLLPEPSILLPHVTDLSRHRQGPQARQDQR